MKKLLNMLKGAGKSILMPHKTFPSLSKTPNPMVLIALISTQLFISVMLIGAISMLDFKIENQELVANVFYGIIIVMPLIILLYSMILSFAAKLVGGSGTVLKHFKMLIWTFLHGVAFILIFGLAFSVASVAIPAISNIQSEMMIAQYFGFLYYSIVGMAVAQKISIPRAILAHALTAGSLGLSFYIMSNYLA